LKTYIDKNKSPVIDKIRILHLISSSSFLGAEMVVCELASSLDPCVYNVHVGLIGSPDVVVESFRKVLCGTAASITHFTCGGKISLSAVTEIQKYVENNKINIIHSHGYKSDIFAICAKSFSPSNFVMIATNHNWITSSIKERMYKIIDSIVLSRFDQVIAVSDVLKNEMLSKGIKPERVAVIDNGINVNFEGSSTVRNSIRNELGFSEKHLVIGCVASLTYEKAHVDLIAAFAQLYKTVPESRLVIVGSGFLDNELWSLTATLGLEDSVVFTGYRQDARELYVAFDVFALVSHSEGLPMAMLEAMAASLPVVVSAVGAIPVVINSQDKGLLITPGDISGISDSFIKLARDPALRETLGRNARNEVVTNYSVNRMTRDYEQLYEKVIGRRL